MNDIDLIVGGFIDSMEPGRPFSEIDVIKQCNIPRENHPAIGYILDIYCQDGLITKEGRFVFNSDEHTYSIVHVYIK